MWPFFPKRFVRREKEIVETRLEVAEVETLRYKQRMVYLEGELKELQDSLNAEREKLQVLKSVFRQISKTFAAYAISWTNIALPQANVIFSYCLYLCILFFFFFINFILYTFYIFLDSVIGLIVAAYLCLIRESI